MIDRFFGVKTVPAVTAAIALLLCASTGVKPAFAASNFATIVVHTYLCSSNDPAAFVALRLTNVDDNSSLLLQTDRDGRAGNTRIPAGPYLLSIVSNAHTPQRYGIASRALRVDGDDLLTVRLGTYDVASAHDRSSEPDRSNLEGGVQAHPVCDSAMVPAAAQTVDRYIVR